jgi:hypothetical protein
MKRLFALQTGLTRKENTELVQNLNEDDDKILMDLEFDLSVDLVDDEDILTSIMVGNIINLEKLKSFLFSKNVNFEVEDITHIFTDESDEEVVNQLLESLSEEDIFKKLEVNV